MSSYYHFIYPNLFLQPSRAILLLLAMLAFGADLSRAQAVAAEPAVVHGVLGVASVSGSTDSSRKPAISKDSGLIVTRAEQYSGIPSDEAGIGDFVRLWVNDPAALDAMLAHGPLIIYVDGIPLKGCESEYNAMLDGSILFRIQHSHIDSNAWRVFYHFPRAHTRRVSLSLGPVNGKAAKSTVAGFGFVVEKQTPFVAFTLSATLIIIGVILLGWFTSLLRDEGGKDATFSLGRTQLAFWSVVVSLSYAYVWSVIGRLPELPGSSLAMLGISIAGTAAAKITDGKDPNPPAKSEWFLWDILSDGSGLSIHRLQLLVWTVILGTVYVRSVIGDLTLPEFDSNTMILMGISTSGYVVLKSQEIAKPGPGQIALAPTVPPAPSEG